MRFFLVFILSFPLVVQAQSWHIRYTIPWSAPIENTENIKPKDLLEFRLMNYGEFNALIPRWNTLFPWDGERLQPEVHFFHADYEEIPLSGYSEYTALFEKEIAIESKILHESKKSYLQISFAPFRLNPVNGKPERLKSFVLEIKSNTPPLLQKNPEKKSSSVNSSLLAVGNWFKIRVPQTGIYKLSYEQLRSIGIDEPSSTRVYGWGGAMLPEDATQGTQDDLNQVQIFMEKGSDGIFGPGDFILFYAHGPVTWQYKASEQIYLHELNSYSDYGFYFLTSGNGSPEFPADALLQQGEPDYFTSSYDFRDYHEIESVNLIKSGREWYGEDFYTSGTQRSFNFNIPGLIMDKPVKFSSELLAHSSENSSFYIYGNTQLLDTVTIRYANTGDYTATYAFTSNAINSFLSNSENVSLKYLYNRAEPKAEAWLDYINLTARAELMLHDGFLYFRDGLATGITEFELSGTAASTIIWDVTKIHDIRTIKASLSGSTARFKIYADASSEFVAFNPSANFPSPQTEGVGLGKVENQDLHGTTFPDMVIVCYPDFLESANRLAAHRREFNQLEVQVVTPEMVYNEFSSGRPDVTAIRNYMRYLYHAAGDDPSRLPQYLLLFGDGSYFYKTENPNKKSLVPTYQSVNSLSPTVSYVSDDYFAILDDGEGMINGLLDIGVGRLPVNSSEEAVLMTDKIIGYEKPDRMGDWRNTLCFIGDDEDFNTHFNQANSLAENVVANYPNFNVSKIFLDAYKQISTPVGQRYPEVNKAINDQIAKGALIINYTGHGGPGGLAHEKILELNDIVSWQNTRKLPLFMTATCEFSRFDDPDNVSAGEEVILNSRGGGIALFSTTRLVYSGPNHALNERFYEIVFEKDSMNNDYSLGDIMKYSKNNTGAGINKRNFTLLGDPAMKLTYPYYSIKTDSINHLPISGIPDTIEALQKVVISGHVEDIKGNLNSGFEGLLFPIVYDKESTRSTLANDGGTTKTFKTRNNIVYKGTATIEEGRFSFIFIVPKDISYAFGTGKISYYASDSVIDAAGSNFNLVVGGSSGNAGSDLTGPELEIFMNSDNFRSGGITDENPILLLKIYDENGINITGTGIGHDITANLNENYKNPISLNEYYLSNPNSYQSGKVEYPFFKLEEGRHTISVKVWDIFNNSSVATTDFVVVRSEEMILKNILNYPNPFSDFTEFSFEHNKPSVDLDIRIDIFDMYGNLVKTIKAKQFDSGYISEPLIWNTYGESRNRNKQGIYIYRLEVKSSDGYEAKGSGKLIIAR